MKGIFGPYVIFQLVTRNRTRDYTVINFSGTHSIKELKVRGFHWMKNTANERKDTSEMVVHTLGQPRSSTKINYVERGKVIKCFSTSTERMVQDLKSTQI